MFIGFDMLACKVYKYTREENNFHPKKCAKNNAVEIRGFGLCLHVTNVLTSICLRSENKAAEFFLPVASDSAALRGPTYSKNLLNP